MIRTLPLCVSVVVVSSVYQTGSPSLQQTDPARFGRFLYDVVAASKIAESTHGIRWRFEGDRTLKLITAPQHGFDRFTDQRLCVAVLGAEGRGVPRRTVAEIDFPFDPVVKPGVERFRFDVLAWL